MGKYCKQGKCVCYGFAVKQFRSRTGHGPCFDSIDVFGTSMTITDGIGDAVPGDGRLRIYLHKGGSDKNSMHRDLSKAEAKALARILEHYADTGKLPVSRLNLETDPF